MKTIVLSIFQDGNALIFVLPSQSYEGHGRVLIRVEVIDRKLVITHLCTVKKIDSNLECQCTKTAIKNYLKINPWAIYDEIVQECEPIALQPNWKVWKEENNKKIEEDFW